MGEVMSQGLDGEHDTRKWAGQTVSVVQELNGDNGHSTAAFDGRLAAGIIPDSTLVYPSAGSLSHRPNACEVLIRALDIVGSVTLLFLAAPVMVLITFLIRTVCGGPSLYKQKRVGKNGKIFTLYKFRTMVNHADKIWGFLPASQDDVRVTSIGKVLRRTRLDELPQVFNVLKGDMSLVGPRPENIYRVSQHKALQGIRLRVKPGLTGLAQIRSSYDLKPEHKLRYDFLYIQRRSLLLNLYILLQTIPVIFSKKGW
jgi:lipopolysaccharide/colanic/teichoic acid biosynthesis glycosyltransferase